MADVMTPEQRSRCMSRIRGKDTKSELILRRALWSQGLRYRLKSKLPGKPDIVFPGARVVVFVDGCFWHGCPEHATAPKTNRKFWSKKLKANKDRDLRVTHELEEMGWTVLRFWEHEVKQDVGAVVSIIQSHINTQ